MNDSMVKASEKKTDHISSDDNVEIISEMESYVESGQFSCQHWRLWRKGWSETRTRDHKFFKTYAPLFDLIENQTFESNNQ